MEAIGARAETGGAASSEVAAECQYLTFALGGVEYGIEILKVQEIKGNTAITPVPNTAAYVKGVMNLRGTVIPVVDLRERLSIPGPPPSGPTVIIVVAIAPRLVGLIVDAVSDVLDVRGADVDPAPELGSRIEGRFLQGIARITEKLVVLLDIDRLLATTAVGGIAGGEGA